MTQDEQLTMLDAALDAIAKGKLTNAKIIFSFCFLNNAQGAIGFTAVAVGAYLWNGA
ncbi:MAG: hypothetical protein R2766_13015 [Saprospiraceae bacterium]